MLLIACGGFGPLFNRVVWSRRQPFCVVLGLQFCGFVLGERELLLPHTSLCREIRFRCSGVRSLDHVDLLELLSFCHFAVEVSVGCAQV